jgi:predicted metal-dependent hydrolase
MDRERSGAPVRAPLTGRGAPPAADGQLRRIVLGGEALDYRLFRVRRRSIGMHIGLAGLAVRAPRWVTIRDIESTLVERAAWILRTLAQWRERRREVLPRAWVTGAPILYAGNELALAVFPSREKAVRPDLFHLTVRHPSAHDERQVADFVHHWLRDEALRVLAPRVQQLAGRVSRSMPPIRLSNARTEWGSCNQKGEIRLNWRLVHLPPRLAEYVVAHEVAHLVELNHSPRFWAVVEALFPGHAEARHALHDWTALLDA